jgi:eukaryotic-like serine/threonine-protein kinase
MAPLSVVPQSLSHAEALDLDLGLDAEPAAPSETAEDWGPYRLTRALGHGRLGVVYEAQAAEKTAGSSPPVALHVLPLDTDPTRRAALEQLFTQAVQQAAALDHPHIVRVRDTGVVRQGVYMACEWLQGRTLSAAWQSGWQANPAEAALLVSRLADGLAYAHARGLVHGGISPGTVFLADSGQPKLLGLGWAGAATASNLPELDPMVAGTAHYLAPEQLQGGEIDARTDVHTLGALLFELLAGRQAFAGHTVPQVVQALVKHAPLAPHLGKPDVPQRLSEIAMRALNREPADRYASAAALSADLQDWLRSVQAQPAGQAAGGAAGKFKRRWLTGALAVAASAAVALTLTDRGAPDKSAVPDPVPVVAPKPAPVSPALVTPLPASPAASQPTAQAPVTLQVMPPATALATPSKPAPAPVVNKPAPSATKPAPAVAAKPATSTPPNAVAALAVLNFAISPWGQVEVNGKAMGASPPLTRLSLPEGTHQVVVRNGDAPPYSTAVQVSADQPTTVRHRFAP